MKKALYLIAGLALTATSCADTNKPVLQDPTSFVLNSPAFADQVLETTGDMDNKSTFTITCSQPNYGFATRANYNLQVSMAPEFVDEIPEVLDNDGNVVTEKVPANYVTIKNTVVYDPTMQLRTYDLAVAMCKLLGIQDKDGWNAYKAEKPITGLKVYMRAVCDITGVPSSMITSNVVSYNNVSLAYAVPKAGFIFIVGNVSDWTAPEAGNKAFYENFKLIEPEIGCKIYAGTFTQPASKGEGIDDQTAFRFFTELNGWADKEVQIASNPNDFYREPITGLFVGGLYKGDAVYGQGSWAIYLTEPTPVTIAVSLVDKKKPKVWFKIGTYNVTIGKNASGISEPVFNDVE